MYEAPVAASAAAAAAADASDAFCNSAGSQRIIVKR